MITNRRYNIKSFQKKKNTFKFKHAKAYQNFSTKHFHIYVNNNFISNLKQKHSIHFFFGYHIINGAQLGETLQMGD